MVILYVHFKIDEIGVNPSLTDIIMINKHPFKLLEKTTLEDYLLHIPEHIPPPTNFSKVSKYYKFITD